MNNTSAPELNPRDQIQFAAFHRVGLEAGDYILDVAQHTNVSGAPDFKSAPQAFSVLCERYLMSPDQIHAVFPPPGGNGNYWRDLPHLILERSTLPWERTAKQNETGPSSDPPWLALLLFHQGDPGGPPKLVKTKGWSRLSADSGTAKFPPPTPESGDHDDDQFNVIDVPAELLRAQLGDAFSFDYQTHVRRRLAYLGNTLDSLNNLPTTVPEPPITVIKLPKPDKTVVKAFENCAAKISLSADATIELYDTGRWRIRDPRNRAEYDVWAQTDPPNSHDLYRVAHENAILLGNRLPMPGTRNVIHLVSLEGRWDGSKFDWAGGTDTYRLVSLFQWEFFCVDPKLDFLSLMKGLNKAGETPSGFRLPPSKQTPKSNETANFLASGFVPLRHRFRQGDRSVSWYHGPFVPHEVTGATADTPGAAVKPGVSLPASAADKLLIFDQTSGMFDASYAAAWELGRMLMLRSTTTAVALTAWKHRYVSTINARRHEADFGYALPIAHGIAGASGSATQLPDEVDAFLNDLTFLRHVPFNYLVPDPNLLPRESLRFFTVDRAWIECLRDGAFSIGRVTAADGETPSAATLPVLSGILLRSEIVSGFYPKLRVKGYTKVVRSADEEVSNLAELKDGEYPRYPAAQLVRMEQLSQHVMLCLFADLTDAVQVVDIHLKQEMLHFGFDETVISQTFDPADAGWETHIQKKLRDAQGNESKDRGAIVTPIPLVDAASRIVKMNALADAIKTALPKVETNPLPRPDPGKPLDASIFALEMIAGTQLGRFRRTKPG